MQFHLSEEQLAIQDSLRGTLAETVNRDVLHALVDSEDDFHPASWRSLCELGLMGIAVAEEAGGAGLGLVDAALAVEVAGEAGAPGPLVGQMLTAIALSRCDSSAVREQYLDGVVAGDSVATLAWNNAPEPGGWEVATDGVTVTGTVRFVQAAHAAKLFLVGTVGGGMALVAAGEGVEITAQPSTDRSRKMAAVTFANAPVVHAFDAGSPTVNWLFNAALVLFAADAFGGAERCLEMSVSYAKEREQFGHPIGQFQALKHQLATMALEVESARGLLWYAAYALDSNLPDAQHAAAMAKAHISDRAVSVARAAVAAHGGIGYTWEYGLNIWFRRAAANAALLGSAAQHRERAAQMRESAGA
ncbi:acyl-CoA dehydrogenase family protein [Haliea salexigens]|uniref:acyl-CoA dehydrogenase family protein n=1 Tax=Haliea salexigens TaxID=287487 RepID=UPI000425F968|nr:acyl-CoA dehydrogenase family protein [Haliea salexigens]|tara:strand:- start:37796 stop:38875 length:1080 start_codon:yes stop_codon:yes gene_type:complete